MNNKGKATKEKGAAVAAARPAALQSAAEGAATCQWYAVRTATRQEAKARDALAELGVPVFLPLQTRWAAPWKGRREKVQRPLIPGYLFVLCGEATFEAVHEAERVHAFVTYLAADGQLRPFPFPLAEVMGLQLQEAEGLFDETLVKRQAYRPRKGDKVRAVAGTWMGYVGKVLATPRGERVHLLMEGPGGRGVVLPIGQVERVA